MIHYKVDNFNCKNATIWVVKDIECRLCNSGESVVIDKYSKGRIVQDYSGRYVIAEFEDGKIVRVNKKYILINLPDVMQKEVIYSMTNATGAVYNINGSDIPGVTGNVLYEGMLDDGNMKAPLMYRTAEKLYKAEACLLRMGLTIKVYDTYRPYTVTRYLYEKMLDIAEQHSDVLNRVINGFEYSQKWFLAENASSHNYGAAIDMTLVDIEKDEELKMQTKVHNLSVLSVIDYNNKNANLLARVMKKNGFSSLRSEWWHFQDNESEVAVMDFYIK